MSRLVIGTACFDDRGYAGLPPLAPQVIYEIVDAAICGGVRLFDTAPGYGRSELVLGDMLYGVYAGTQPINVVTKVSPASPDEMLTSIEHSLTSLRRQQIDILLLHNATVDALNSEAFDVLLSAKATGEARLIGASVYTINEALAAIHAGVDVIEVPVNLLDQRMCRPEKWRGRGAESICEAAERDGVMVLARSAWLRGALTNEHAAAPIHVYRAVNQARRELLARWNGLSELALRFVLGQPGVSKVVIGPRSVAEVQAALDAERSGALSWWRSWLANRLPEQPENVWDVRKWDTT